MLLLWMFLRQPTSDIQLAAKLSATAVVDAQEELSATVQEEAQEEIVCYSHGQSPHRHDSRTSMVVLHTRHLAYWRRGHNRQIQDWVARLVHPECIPRGC